MILVLGEMAEQIRAHKPAASFEYELFEGDPDHLRTVVATPTQTRPWIDPTSLKLKHRIGRGPFGDVWLATHHQSADDFDEYHELAVKMLLPLKEDCAKVFVNKFEELFPKFRESQSVCWLHGISVINGKVFPLNFDFDFDFIFGSMCIFMVSFLLIRCFSFPFTDLSVTRIGFITFSSY